MWNLVKPVSFIFARRPGAIPHAVEKSSTAKIESVALSETYSSVTRLKVSKVRSEGWAARLKTTELPVGINPGALGDTVSSGSRLALPQSNLDRSTMHKWSNDPRAVHKLVTYSVTTLSGTLGAIPLRVSRARARSLPFTPPRFLSLFSPLFRPAKRKMYRAVTFPPLNPSEWAVPPWRTYRTNFAPVHDAARSLKGMKAVSIYRAVGSQLSLCSFRDLFIALHGGGPSSTIPYGPPHRRFVTCRRARKYGDVCDELS